MLLALEDVPLAQDGTMSEYCKILRTNPGEPLKVQALRPETGEILEGEINGAPLEPVETAPPPDDGGGDPSGVTTAVSDDSGAVAMEVPAEWSDVDGASQDFSGVTADATVTAATDVAAWREGYEEPGAAMSASRELASQYTPEELLDANDFSAGCQDTTREPYDDGNYAGYVDAYTGCGESGNELVMVAATPPSGEYMLVLLIQTPPTRPGTRRGIASSNPPP